MLVRMEERALELGLFMQSEDETYFRSTGNAELVSIPPPLAAAIIALLCAGGFLLSNSLYKRKKRRLGVHVPDRHAARA